MISNGNRIEWSPIRSVIIRVITKSDDRASTAVGALMNVTLKGFYSVLRQTILLVNGEPLGSERVNNVDNDVPIKHLIILSFVLFPIIVF